MVEQEIHHPAVGPLNRRPELELLHPPLVQLPAPLAQALRGVRHRARGELRPALIHHPDRMRLIRPIDSEVVAHSPSSFFWRRGRGAGTAGWPYTGPPGDHFLWNLHCRSLADRDSLLPSLRGLGGARSSGQQAPGRHAWPPMRPPTLFPPQERVTLLEVGLSIRWSRRVIIKLGFSPDQSREINHLPTGRSCGEGQPIRYASPRGILRLEVHSRDPGVVILPLWSP